MSIRLKNLWIIHLLGWLLFLMLPLTIMSREPDRGVQVALLTSVSFWSFFLIYLIAFYANTFFFFPKIFLKKHFGTYVAIFVCGFLLVFYTQPFENMIFKKYHNRQDMQSEREQEMFDRPPGPGGDFEGEMPPPRPGRGGPRNSPAVDFVSLVLFVVVWVAGMATKMSEQWRLSEKRAILSEADKAQAELSFFKAQINPHFLFNTLNNIYAMAVSQSENTAPSIMKLSRMMRYITEEATEDFVPLADEVACLENYIDLQKLRLNGKTKVTFTHDGDFEDIKIAPLILMTFVENAFKYGVSNRFENEIAIRLKTRDEGILFTCMNQIFEPATENERQGIGIANTRKRLEFLYTGQYELGITHERDRFMVRLRLSDKS